jgi:hypothetical protein
VKTFAELKRECLDPPNAAERQRLALSMARPRPQWFDGTDDAWRAEADYVPTKLLPQRTWDPSRTPPYEVVWAWEVKPPPPLLALPAPPPLALPAPPEPPQPRQLELFP